MKALTIDNDIQTLLQTIAEIASDSSKTILLLFTGSKGPSGQSWCPDCNDTEPVIHEVLSAKSDDVVFITIYVGDRDTWKNPNNAFRTHNQLRVKCVPTLINWQNSNRLEEQQLADRDLLEMLLED